MCDLFPVSISRFLISSSALSLLLPYKFLVFTWVDDEKISGSFKIIEKLNHESREDFGIIKIELIGEKTITEASMKAYEKSGFKGVGNIKDGKIRVLTMEMLLAIPKGVAFQ